MWFESWLIWVEHWRLERDRQNSRSALTVTALTTYFFDSDFTPGFNCFLSPLLAAPFPFTKFSAQFAPSFAALCFRFWVWCPYTRLRLSIELFDNNYGRNHVRPKQLRFYQKYCAIIYSSVVIVYILVVNISYKFSLHLYMEYFPSVFDNGVRH